MRKIRLLVIIGLMVAAFPTSVWAAPSGPSSVLGVTVLPAPAVVGTTTTINWDSDLSGSGTVSFRVYVPADWYDSTNWKAGTGVTQGTLTGWTYTVSSCADTTIGTTNVICAQYSATNGTGDTIDSINLSFALSSSAVAGANRPVRVTQVSGSAGTPNISTVYVTVSGPPSVRYVGNTDCGANTPCDTGVSGLANALAALPTTGGTVYVSGAYQANGAAIGAKNIILRPVDAGSSLTAGTCSSSGNRLVTLDGTGNLVVDGLNVVGGGYAPAGGCFVGVAVTGSGSLTVQNGATFQNWFGDGVSGGYGVSINGSGSHSITAATFSGNATGLFAGAGTTTVNGATFTANSDGGVLVFGSNPTLTIQNSTVSNTTSGYGLFQYAGNVTLRGNTFSNNANFAFVNAGGTMTAYANNVTGNHGGGFQAYVSTVDAAAKNWWSSASNAAVGPTSDGSTSYATGWAHRLGAAVSAWAAGSNSAALGSAGLSGGTGTAVIIDFGRGSLDAPFGVGVPPYVNQVCSDYYDFYVMSGGSGTWNVYLPIDLSVSGCQANVLFKEIAYTIAPTAYDTVCTTPTNKACWSQIPVANIMADTNNNRLVISQSAAQLAYTHIVAGDATGADPTAVTLQDLSATARAETAGLWPVLVGALGLLAVGGWLARRWAKQA